MYAQSIVGSVQPALVLCRDWERGKAAVGVGLCTRQSFCKRWL